MESDARWWLQQIAASENWYAIAALKEWDEREARIEALEKELEVHSMTFWEVGIDVAYEGSFHQRYYRTEEAARADYEKRRNEYDDYLDTYWPYIREHTFQEDK